MEFPILALGVLLAFGVFGATLFSISQALSQQGWLQRAHLGSVICVLAIMGALLSIQENWSFFGLPAPLVVIVAGGALLVVASAAVMLEDGWSRLNPAPLAILGLVAVSGAPLGV